MYNGFPGMNLHNITIEDRYNKDSLIDYFKWREVNLLILKLVDYDAAQNLLHFLKNKINKAKFPWKN